MFDRIVLEILSFECLCFPASLVLSKVYFSHVQIIGCHKLRFGPGFFAGEHLNSISCIPYMHVTATFILTTIPGVKTNITKFFAKSWHHLLFLRAFDECLHSHPRSNKWPSHGSVRTYVFPRRGLTQCPSCLNSYIKYAMHINVTRPQYRGLKNITVLKPCHETALWRSCDKKDK